MKVETFYVILDEDYKKYAVPYARAERTAARETLKELARKNPGKTFHLMKREVSVLASDLTWYDSE